MWAICAGSADERVMADVVESSSCCDGPMNTETMRALVTQVQREREETAARLHQYDTVLSNLRELYPELFQQMPISGRVPGPATGIVADHDLVALVNDTRMLVSAIYHRSSPGIWLSPKEVHETAVSLGWRAPERSPDPVAVIRNYIKESAELESRKRDGRTKEYRLKTPGGVIDATPPGSAPTERPGGDGHAAGPDPVPDHDQAFGGRDDRDHYRETGNPVVNFWRRAC